MEPILICVGALILIDALATFLVNLRSGDHRNF